jgi:hypothetical protein
MSPDRAAAAAAGLQQLRELNLGWCHTVGSEDVQALSGLTRLTSLELARTRVSIPIYMCKVLISL